MEATGGVSRRGRKQFNDSLAPAEWSFSTYVRPFKSAGSGPGAADLVQLKYTQLKKFFGHCFLVLQLMLLRVYRSIHRDTTDADLYIDFSESNKATLGTADIFFVLGDANRKVYKLKDCVVNEASLDFDIDGIATINWSGMSSEIIDMTTKTHTTATSGSVFPPAFDAHRDGGTVDIEIGDVVLNGTDAHRMSVVVDPTSSGTATMTGAVYEATIATDNFIRNRLTQLTVIPTTQILQVMEVTN